KKRMMNNDQEYSDRVQIKNPLGFHVRPVQRFSELARAFAGDVEVEINDKKADGKSVMGLMSLGAQSGSEMKIITRGPDARQALDVLKFVVGENFFVEDLPESSEEGDRHIERLARFSSCFECDIWVEVEGQKVRATDQDALKDVGLEPTSAVQFHVEGDDGEQAEKVLGKLAEYSFYVEEAMGSGTQTKG
ncbi:MAG: HPr family phosphocarrier protein, partial [Planctomycetota bacterium]